ncbi:DUF2634 domain-containing protein [Clostridium sp. AM58-1XD]|uniref:DUF2634 domain-containing protein n=1 Tax=Clostridium sp. AM58-1XD TaxID=2292307 RepID=UPI000E4F040B|nr:DUF2634 domain-containing protein [Clostridium sp. AM58-1XD]RGY97274.1 DUF2634 domain-containing protein [Clostridium sp. AM58-1XD]
MAILPQGVGLDAVLKHADKPTNTFMIDWPSKQISGMNAGLEAVRQAVEIILRTERFRWQIYSSNFGIELEDLPGEEYDYMISEIPRRIKEAFSMDNRMISVESFVFSDNQDGVMTCAFDVITVFGTLSEEVVIT